MIKHVTALDSRLFVEIDAATSEIAELSGINKHFENDDLDCIISSILQSLIENYCLDKQDIPFSEYVESISDISSTIYKEISIVYDWLAEQACSGLAAKDIDYDSDTVLAFCNEFIEYCLCIVTDEPEDVSTSYSFPHLMVDAYKSSRFYDNGYVHSGKMFCTLILNVLSTLITEYEDGISIKGARAIVRTISNTKISPIRVRLNRKRKFVVIEY